MTHRWTLQQATVCVIYELSPATVLNYAGLNKTVIITTLTQTLEVITTNFTHLFSSNYHIASTLITTDTTVCTF